MNKSHTIKATDFLGPVDEHSLARNYHVEAFDERGRDVLPPRTYLVAPDMLSAEKAVEALGLSTKPSYIVLTGLKDAIPDAPSQP